ncbi:MAG: phage holin family protein [Hyphomicrobiales bacterium]|nr:phage holin family protein [Hyphomicrobiales bacterium]MDE2115406.1 phage holin family protein [Hyphomicrobiales bacterium]
MNRPPASPARLFSEIAEKSLALLEVELTIFNAEIAEKRARALHTLVWLVLAAVIGLGAFGLLLTALLLSIIEWGLSPWLAALALAVAMALIAYLAIRHALALLRGLNFSLPQTMAELRKSARLLTRSGLHVRS